MVVAFVASHWRPPQPSSGTGVRLAEAIDEAKSEDSAMKLMVEIFKLFPDDSCEIRESISYGKPLASFKK